MEIVQFDTEKHFEICKSWWKYYKWEAPPINMLDRGHGFVVQHKDKKTYLAAGWFYGDETSPLAVFEWVVKNPEIGKIQSFYALSKLYEEAEKRAKEMKIPYVFQYLQHRKLIEFVKLRGYMETDKDMTIVLKIMGDK
jgi:hypothetical protein